MGVQAGVTEALTRCAWASGSELEERYHDLEWGVPQRDPRVLFEFLVLEGAQAGLSWRTILNKRDRYREVYDGFDPARIADYGEAKTAELLADQGIIRNRAKVAAAVTNAKAWLALEDEAGDVPTWLWSFVDGRPRQPRRRATDPWRATSDDSDALSKALKRRGFTFVGSTIMYAYMQACGFVNDHPLECFRHAPCAALAR
jgi:DNA-3-methyladenine glycosylase I